MRLLHSLSALASLLLLAFSCRPDGGDRSSATVLSKLDQAGRLMELYQYEDGVRLGFEALSMAEASPEDVRIHLRCLAHERLSSIFLTTYRDSLAWEHAQKAEQLAQAERNDSLYVRALILKGRVCTYANFAPDNNRDEEALALFLKALRIAEDHGYDALVQDACYRLSEIYVHMNRWNDPLKPALYESAGHFLERAESYGTDDPNRRTSHFRMRYLRQGGRIAEAISYCEGILEGALPDDDLIRWQMYDHLTNLYLQDGQVKKAQEAHQAYSHDVQQYMQRKADVVAQEMMDRYELELRDRQIHQRSQLLSLLLLLLILSVAALVTFIRQNRIISRQSREIADTALAREQLFAHITRDLSDASVTDIDNHGIIQFIRRWPDMEEEEILRESQSLSIGDKPLDPVIIRHIADLMIARKKRLEDMELTAQEVNIIRLSRKGLSDKQIADTLCLSPRTVSNHKYRIYAKLDVSGNAEMLNKVAELGF